MTYSNQQLKKIESAVSFLVAQYTIFSKNAKPAILHSVKVGAKLMEFNMPTDVVIAGFLHDLLEDTKCTKQMIQKKFGRRVANYVVALTMDYQFTFYQDRWYDGMNRIKKAGRNILLIKLIDSNDNLPYYVARLKHDTLGLLLWRVHLVLSVTKKEWGHLGLYRQFGAAYRAVKKSKKIVLP